MPSVSIFSPSMTSVIFECWGAMFDPAARK